MARCGHKHAARSADISVAAAALSPARLVDPGERRVPLQVGSTSALVAAANAMPRIPGTPTAAIDAEEPALVIHLVRLDDPAVATLRTVAAAALSTVGPI